MGDCFSVLCLAKSTTGEQIQWKIISISLANLHTHGPLSVGIIFGAFVQKNWQKLKPAEDSMR